MYYDFENGVRFFGDLKGPMVQGKVAPFRPPSPLIKRKRLALSVETGKMTWTRTTIEGALVGCFVF